MTHELRKPIYLLPGLIGLYIAGLIGFSIFFNDVLRAAADLLASTVFVSCLGGIVVSANRSKGTERVRWRFTGHMLLHTAFIFIQVCMLYTSLTSADLPWRFLVAVLIGEAICTGVSVALAAIECVAAFYDRSRETTSVYVVLLK